MNTVWFPRETTEISEVTYDTTSSSDEWRHKSFHVQRNIDVIAWGLARRASVERRCPSWSAIRQQRRQYYCQRNTNGCLPAGLWQENRKTRGAGTRSLSSSSGPIDGVINASIGCNIGPVKLWGTSGGSGDKKMAAASMRWRGRYPAAVKRAIHRTSDSQTTDHPVVRATRLGPLSPRTLILSHAPRNQVHRPGAHALK